MSRHLSFYNNDTLLQDNSEPGYFTEFTVPDNTNLIVCYDDDYKITCNIRVTASSNQDIINYQFSTDSAVFLLKSLQNYTQNQTVRAQITVSNIAKDSNNIAQDIQNYLQSCGVGSGSSIDLSGVIAAINSIAASLSSLSSLAHLADLANIITAIQNKDNQSDIVNILDRTFNFIDNNTGPARKRNVFCGHGYGSVSGFSNYPLTSRPNNFYTSVSGALIMLRNVFLDSNLEYYVLPSLQNKSLNSVSSELNNIETKLEQNLPFTTIVENDIVETNVAQNCSYGSKIEQIPFTE